MAMSEVYAFSQYKPDKNDIILFDTSLYLAFLGYDTYGKSIEDKKLNTKKECNDLINHIVEADAIIAVSIITKIEAQKVMLQQRFATCGYDSEKQRKQLKAENPKKYNEIIGESNNDSENSLKLFMKMPNVYDEIVGSLDNEILLKANEIQLQSNLHGLNDAMQIAIAEHEEISHFAAIDSDFKTVDNNLTILLDSNSINK